MHRPRKPQAAGTMSGDHYALRESRAVVEGVWVAEIVKGQPLLVWHHVVAAAAEAGIGVAS